MGREEGWVGGKRKEGGRREGGREEGRTCKDETGKETKNGTAGNVYHAPIQ